MSKFIITHIIRYLIKCISYFEFRNSGYLIKKIRNWGLIFIVVIASIFGFTQLTKKSPEQIEFEQQVKAVTLEGKVEEFPIEGRDHVPAETT